MAPAATCVLISARFRFIISVLAVGVIIAAPTPRAGQMAPKRWRCYTLRTQRVQIVWPLGQALRVSA